MSVKGERLLLLVKEVWIYACNIKLVRYRLRCGPLCGSAARSGSSFYSDHPATKRNLQGSKNILEKPVTGWNHYSGETFRPLAHDNDKRRWLHFGCGLHSAHHSAISGLQYFQEKMLARRNRLHPQHCCCLSVVAQWSLISPYSRLITKMMTIHLFAIQQRGGWHTALSLFPAGTQTTMKMKFCLGLTLLFPSERAIVECWWKGPIMSSSE